MGIAHIARCAGIIAGGVCFISELSGVTAGRPQFLRRRFEDRAGYVASARISWIEFGMCRI